MPLGACPSDPAARERCSIRRWRWSPLCRGGDGASKAAVFVDCLVPPLVMARSVLLQFASLTVDAVASEPSPRFVRAVDALDRSLRLLDFTEAAQVPIPVFVPLNWASPVMFTVLSPSLT